MQCLKVGVLRKGEKASVDSLLAEFLRECSEGDIGAFAVFVGIVKGRVEGGEVHALSYTVIEDLAAKSMERIAREIAEKYGLKGVAIYHYEGELPPGELSLLVAVAGYSRANVFPALQEAVERVKKEVPVFKLEKRSDGEYWIIGDSQRVRRVK